MGTIKAEILSCRHRDRSRQNDLPPFLPEVMVFRAVDDIVVAIAPGTRVFSEDTSDPACRFGQGEAADPFARGKGAAGSAFWSSVPLSTGIGTQPTDEWTDMMVEQAPSAAAISSKRQRIGDDAGFGSAMGLGDQHAQPARPSGSVPRAGNAWSRSRTAAPGASIAGEIPRHVADLFLFLGQRSSVRRFRWRRPWPRPRRCRARRCHG